MLKGKKFKLFKKSKKKKEENEEENASASVTSTTGHVITSPKQGPMKSPTASPKLPEDATEIDKQFEAVLSVVAEPFQKDRKKYEDFVAQFKTNAQKWQLVMMYSKAQQQNVMNKVGGSPTYFIEKLKDVDSVLNSNNLLKQLAISLRSQPINWVSEFVNFKGIYYLSAVISSIVGESSKSEVDYNNLHDTIQCYYAILNTDIGLREFLKQSFALRNLVLVMHDCLVKTKTTILLILGLLNHHSDEALMLIMDAMTHYKLVTREKQRFFELVENLKATNDFEFKINCMIFFNSLLNSVSDYQLKMDLQQEFINLDILNILRKSNEKLVSVPGELQTQMEIFEEELMDNDFEDLMNTKMSDPNHMFKILVNQLTIDSQAALKNIVRDFLSISNAEDADMIRDANWQTMQALVQYAIQNRDEKGLIKDVTHSLNVLNEKILIQQQVLNTLETDVINEKLQLLQLLKNNLQPQSSPFEFKFLKQVYDYLVQDFKTALGSVPVATEAPAAPPAPTPPSPAPPAPPAPTPPSSAAPPPPPPPMPPQMGPPPPPPPGAPAPPAPGMLGLFGGVQYKLPNYNPTKNLRNFHIDSIPKNKISKTIFVKKGIIEKTNEVKLNSEELEEMFGIEKKEEEGGDTAPSTSDEPAIKIISLLDPKRSYNIGIQLASMRLTFMSIKRGILELNEKTLGQQQINILKSIAPTPEEVKMFNGFSGDMKTLSQPDLFIMEMKNIKFLKERLECWDFKIRCDGEIASIRPDIETMIMGIDQVQNSEHFAELLSIILATSNYLNAKSKYKNTLGFRVSTSLMKLQDTRSTKGSTTLLHYIVEYITKSYPHLLEFYTQISMCDSIKKISLSSIKENLANLSKSSTQLSNLLKSYEKIKHEMIPNDRFLDIMTPFHEKASQEIQLTKARLEVLTKKLDELTEFMDEDKTIITNKPEDFFEKLSSFILAFKTAHKALVEKKQKEAQLLKKQKVMEEMKTNKEPLKHVPTPAEKPASPTIQPKTPALLKQEKTSSPSTTSASPSPTPPVWKRKLPSTESTNESTVHPTQSGQSPAASDSPTPSTTKPPVARKPTISKIERDPSPTNTENQLPEWQKKLLQKKEIPQNANPADIKSKLKLNLEKMKEETGKSQGMLQRQPSGVAAGSVLANLEESLRDGSGFRTRRSIRIATSRTSRRSIMGSGDSPTIYSNASLQEEVVKRLKSVQ